jgi:hypothetical protein
MVTPPCYGLFDVSVIEPGLAGLARKPQGPCVFPFCLPGL